MGWGLLALGLVLLVEGLLWAFAPGLVDQALRALRDLPRDAQRTAALSAAALGLLLVLAGRTLGL